MGKVHLPSFQATLRALKRNLKPWAQGTAAHSLCLTAGALDPGIASPGGLGSIPGGTGISAPPPCAPSASQPVLIDYTFFTP